MSSLGPQQFEIPLSDRLFQTLNPADPIIGIAPTVMVPVLVPWNLQRTELAPDKEVTFDQPRWSGCGPGPHDVYEERLQLGNTRVKTGTVTWSVETVCYQTVQTNAGHHRWLITPCAILLRTYKPLSGTPQIVEALRNPQPCPGRWVNTPPEVAAALEHAKRQPDIPLPKDLVPAAAKPAAKKKKKPAG